MDFLRNLINSAPATPLPTVSVGAVNEAIHPFYPTHIEIRDFIANDRGVVELLSLFAVGCVVILGLTWFLASSFAPHLGSADKWTVLWFCLCMGKAAHKKERTLTASRRFHPLVLRRLFRIQSYPYGWNVGYFWPMVEGVLVVGLKIPDVGSFRVVHGDRYCGEKEP